MRSLSSLITLAIIAAVIAALTVPSTSKFQEFINEKYADSLHLKAVVNDTSTYRLLNIAFFSRNTINVTERRDSLTDNTPTFNTKILYTQRYLGLFGQFWKIKPKKS